MKDNETFNKIRGYGDKYSVSNLGNIRNDMNNKVLAPGVASNGYLTVSLCENGKCHTCTVHRLVAENFVSGKSATCRIVNHIDGDKTNNSADNLEWCTVKENVSHATNILGHKPGKSFRRVLCVNTGETFENVAEASKKMNVNRGNIISVINGNRTTAGGYFWVAIDKPREKWDFYKSRTPVLCVETREMFKNVAEAQKKTNIKNIYNVLSKRREKAGGYHWQRITPDYFMKHRKDV